MRWLTMPLDKLAFFIAEIEPLEAQESLRRVNELRIAQADSKDNKAKMTLITWENQASRLGKVEQPEERKPSRAEYFAMLGAAGIKRV